MYKHMVLAMTWPILLCNAVIGEEPRQPPDDNSLVVGVIRDQDIYTADSACSFYKSGLSASGTRPYRYALFDKELVSGDFQPRWKVGDKEFVMVHAKTRQGHGGAPDGVYAFGLPLERVSFRTAIAEKDRAQGDDAQGLIETIGFGTLGEIWSEDTGELIYTIYSAMRFPSAGEDVADPDRPFANCGFFFDIQPLEQRAYDVFMLTSDALQLAIEKERKDSIGRPIVDKRERQPAAWAPKGWQKGRKALKPMLGVWHKDERKQWALVEQIEDPGFNERFHVFIKGTTYYFVTDSGKIYVAKKPDKGDRTLEVVWKKADQPITGALTDAASGKTFLFGQKGKRGAKDAKPFYFELSEKPEPVAFEESVLVREKVPEPLQTVMAYAHLLAADKKIKIEKKDKP